jgi:hypothetical protein
MNLAGSPSLVLSLQATMPTSISQFGSAPVDLVDTGFDNASLHLDHGPEEPSTLTPVSRRSPIVAPHELFTIPPWDGRLSKLNGFKVKDLDGHIRRGWRQWICTAWVHRAHISHGDAAGERQEKS